MKKRTGVVLLVLLVVAVWWWRRGADDRTGGGAVSEVTDGGEDAGLMLDRVWIDSKPEKYTDYAHVMFALSGAPIGIFQKGSAYRITAEFYEGGHVDVEALAGLVLDGEHGGRIADLARAGRVPRDEAGHAGVDDEVVAALGAGDQALLALLGDRLEGVGARAELDRAPDGGAGVGAVVIAATGGQDERQQRPEGAAGCGHDRESSRIPTPRIPAS